MDFSSEPPPLPAGVAVERRPGGVVILRRWRDMVAWALVPLALTTAGIAAAVFQAMYGLPPSDPMWVIPWVFVLMAVALFYVVLRRLVNVTRLEITPERVTVHHGPLPWWWRSDSLAADTIGKIEVRPYRWRYSGRVVTHHHVWVVHKDGPEVCLLGRDATAAQAGFVAEELRRVTGVAAAA